MLNHPFFKPFLLSMNAIYAAFMIMVAVIFSIPYAFLILPFTLLLAAPFVLMFLMLRKSNIATSRRLIAVFNVLILLLFLWFVLTGNGALIGFILFGTLSICPIFNLYALYKRIH